jgi:hypothetical protein
MMAWGLNADNWGVATAPTYTVTDQEVLGNVQTSLLEPNTQSTTQAWQSGIYTQAQALQFLNNRHRKLIGDTLATCSILYQPALAYTPYVALPQTLSTIRRVAWANRDTPLAYIELPPSDAWEQDHGYANWPSLVARQPGAYMDDHLPSLTIQVVPQASNDGEIELTFSILPAELDGIGAAPGNMGNPLSIPDDYSPYLAWGVRADLLQSEYEGNDPVRAAHAQARFEEGIELLRLLLEGESG